VQAASRKDYTTSLAPGTPIENLDEVGYLAAENYFCPLRLVSYKIEYLRLQRPNHVRILFSKTVSDWTGEFLVP
jgi:hypothetical protein